MSSSRACGLDGITIEMLRMTFPVVCPHLLEMINSSISQCDLSREWKVATVVPLFNPRTGGGLSQPRTGGGGGDFSPPPEISRTTQRIEKR